MSLGGSDNESDSDNESKEMSLFISPDLAQELSQFMPVITAYYSPPPSPEPQAVPVQHTQDLSDLLTPDDNDLDTALSELFAPIQASPAPVTPAYETTTSQLSLAEAAKNVADSVSALANAADGSEKKKPEF